MKYLFLILILFTLPAHAEAFKWGQIEDWEFYFNENGCTAVNSSVKPVLSFVDVKGAPNRQLVLYSEVGFYFDQKARVAVEISGESNLSNNRPLVLTAKNATISKLDQTIVIDLSASFQVYSEEERELIITIDNTANPSQKKINQFKYRLRNLREMFNMLGYCVVDKERRRK